MEFIMDMVHHNPGEAPFETAFINPETLREYGYNAQVFKHINTAVNFSEYDASLFEDAPQAREWIDNLSVKIAAEIARAKEYGLSVYYHIDLFVLPKAVYQRYHNEICDENGKISLLKPKTLELHRAMFDEIFKRFPGVDGFIIRVGETYLHDTPYHIGNGAVPYGCPEKERSDFVTLINFLRDEICEKHDKYLFFRTWDCFPDRFHASPDYYLDVTDRIKPHPKLIFSIKHTALDFWRRVKFNGCLTLGRHRQIIEVQCQREYEGKGAYPMYVMNGVINSFGENADPKGLRDITDNPLICGIFTWTRGGGWFGPYPKNEFWCSLNAFVISQFANNPTQSEEEIFFRFTKEHMNLSPQSAKLFRKMCLLANTAVLKGRYIECYDRTLSEGIMPCGNWMRDDRLGGLRQLGDIFEYLYSHDLLSDAVNEKLESVLLWREVSRIYERISVPDAELDGYIRTSIKYAEKLFYAIYCGWEAMAAGYRFEKTGADKNTLADAIPEFDKAWAEYQTLAGSQYSSTLYKDEYLNEPGLRETIEYFRSAVSE